MKIEGEAWCKSESEFQSRFLVVHVYVVVNDKKDDPSYTKWKITGITLRNAHDSLRETRDLQSPRVEEAKIENTQAKMENAQAKLYEIGLSLDEEAVRRELSKVMKDIRHSKRTSTKRRATS